VVLATLASASCMLMAVRASHGQTSVSAPSRGRATATLPPHP
jgi:hypothetical protein